MCKYLITDDCIYTMCKHSITDSYQSCKVYSILNFYLTIRELNEKVDSISDAVDDMIYGSED